MGDFFKRNRLRFLLCILALLIGVLLYAAMQGGQTTGDLKFLNFGTDPRKK